MAGLIQTWLPLVLTAVNLAGWLWSFIQSPARRIAADLAAYIKASTTKSQAAERDLHDIEKRVSSLETMVKQLPDRETVHKIDLGLTKLEGQMTAMSVSVKAASESVIRIEAFLLEQAQNRKG